MKIRHILPGFGILPHHPKEHGLSGIVGVAYNLALQQLERGWDAELMGLAPAQRDRMTLGPQEPHLLLVRSWPWLKIGNYDFRYFAPAYLQLWAREQVDIHHVYSNPYHLVLGRARKHILHYQTPIYDVPPAYHRAVRHADAVICCSSFIRDQFLRHVDYPSDHVHIVYNGVDLSRFGPGDRAVCRAKLGIPADEKVVLFAGQVNEAKGLLYLVRACRAIAANHKVRLLVAGSSSLWGDAARPEERSPYALQVDDAAAGLRVTFLGKVASYSCSVHAAGDWVR